MRNKLWMRASCALAAGLLASAGASAQSRITLNFSGPFGAAVGNTYANYASFDGAYFAGLNSIAPSYFAGRLGEGEFTTTFLGSTSYFSASTSGGYGGVLAFDSLGRQIDAVGNQYGSTTLPNNFVFNDPDIHSLKFYGAPAFFSTFTFNTPISAAPEPGTWAMMILGFGIAGYALRRRRANFQIAALT